MIFLIKLGLDHSKESITDGIRGSINDLNFSSSNLRGFVTDLLINTNYIKTSFCDRILPILRVII